METILAQIPGNTERSITIGKIPRTFELVPGDGGQHYLDTRLNKRAWRCLGIFTDKELREMARMIRLALKTR